MEIFLVLLFITLGLITAFFSGSLSGLNGESVLNFIDDPTTDSTNIELIKNNAQEYKSALQKFEAATYFIASIFNTAFAILILIGNGAQFFYPKLIVFTIVTFFIIYILRNLVIGVGKRLGDIKVMRFIYAINFIASILKPILYLEKKIIAGISGKSQEDDSREEISALVETAREEGALDDDEYRILKNIMNFSEVLVSDVMTPRTVVFSQKADTTVDEVVKMPEMRMYSRFPIWENESLDDGVIGYVMSKDVLHAALQGKRDKQIREFSREVYFIPENAQLDKALDKFLDRRQHLFVVVDEYGGVEGLLTMEDVLETMLGVEIVDEADKFVDMRVLAKKRRDKRVSAAKKI